MTVYIYPAAMDGCGYYRLIWPARALIRQGHQEIKLILPHQRNDEGVGFHGVMEGDEMVDIILPADASTMVFQRPTHRYLSRALKLLGDKGVRVIVDMDDDLSAINPNNPAFMAYHPRNEVKTEHSWEHVRKACMYADLVTTTTPELALRYAPHGRSVVLPNMVQERYAHIRHDDSDLVGWGGVAATHPDDLPTVGPALNRLREELGAQFRVVGPPEGVATGLQLQADEIEYTGPVSLKQWPHELSLIGIGLAPLANTRFNAAKSWLKPLEYAALGIPCVMSPRADYQRLHRRYGVGLLAEKPKDWYRLIKQLLTQPELRQELGLRAREAVRDLTYPTAAKDWLDVWCR